MLADLMLIKPVTQMLATLVQNSWGKEAYGNVSKTKVEISENVFIFLFIVRGQYVRACSSCVIARHVRQFFQLFFPPLPWHIDVSIVRFFLHLYIHIDDKVNKWIRCCLFRWIICFCHFHKPTHWDLYILKAKASSVHVCYGRLARMRTK